jgi:hypothetical protein
MANPPGVPPHYIRQLDGSYSAPSRLAVTVNPGFAVGHFESTAKPTAVTPPPTKYNKFHVSAASERTADGIVFDSKLEKAAYILLQSLNITFTRQPEYVLQEKFDLNGEHYRAIIYKGDFLLPRASGDLLIDMKGMITKEFAIKRKLLIFRYKIELHCFKSVPTLRQFLIDHGITH